MVMKYTGTMKLYRAADGTVTLEKSTGAVPLTFSPNDAAKSNK